MSVGALAIWAGLTLSGEVRRSKDWPTVSGKILGRQLGEHVGGIKGPSAARLMLVKYSYDVEGKSYSNDQVYPDARTGGDEQTMNAIPAPATVHFNPANPAEAYLLPQPPNRSWLALVFGVVLVVAGLLQLLVALTKAS